MRTFPNFLVVLTAALLTTNAASAEVGIPGSRAATSGDTIVAASGGSNFVLKCAMDVAKPHKAGKLHQHVMLHGSCGDNSPAEGGGGTVPDVTCTAATDDGGTNCNADGPPAPSDPDGPDPSAPPPYRGPTAKPSSPGSTGVGSRPGFGGPGFGGPGFKLPHCAEIHLTNVRYCSSLVSAMQNFCAQQIPRMDHLCARAASS